MRDSAAFLLHARSQYADTANTYSEIMSVSSIGRAQPITLDIHLVSKTQERLRNTILTPEWCHFLESMFKVTCHAAPGLSSRSWGDRDVRAVLHKLEFVACKWGSGCDSPDSIFSQGRGGSWVQLWWAGKLLLSDREHFFPLSAEQRAVWLPKY